MAASRSTPIYAAERGYGFLIPRVGPGEQHKELAAQYRAALGARPGFITQLRFVSVAETAREAHEQTRRTFMRYAKYDCGVEWDGQTDTAEYAALAERMHFLIGTPDQVAERLTVWQREYGFDEIICRLYAEGMRHDDSCAPSNCSVGRCCRSCNRANRLVRGK